MDFSDLRKDYSLAGLSEKSLARDPFRQFEKWFQEAAAAKLPEPNAMVCSLATRDGRPSSRMVLLKRLDARGFVFSPTAKVAKAANSPTTRSPPCCSLGT